MALIFSRPLAYSVWVTPSIFELLLPPRMWRNHITPPTIRAAARTMIPAMRRISFTPMVRP